MQIQSGHWYYMSLLCKKGSDPGDAVLKFFHEASLLILIIKVRNDEYYCYLPFTVAARDTERFSKFPKIAQPINKW